MADPNGFDHFRRGEPIPILPGKVDAGAMDYFRRGEPIVTARLPVTYTDSRTEALTGSESQTATAAFVSAQSETLTGSDAQTVTADFVASASESLSSADSQTGTWTTSGACTETVTITDAATATADFVADITESLAIADESDADVDTVNDVDCDETLTAADECDATVVAGASTSEAGGNWFWFKASNKRRGKAKLQQQALTCEASGTVGPANIGNISGALTSPSAAIDGSVISPIRADADMLTRTLRLESDGTKMEQPSRELIEALMLVDF